MDIVEKAVTNKILNILNNFFNEDDLIKVIKQKIKEKKQEISFEKEIENCKTKLNKLSLEVDSLYNDKLLGILSQDDFVRIYERKKEEKESFKKKIDELNIHIKNNAIDENKLVKNIVTKFQNLKQINRETLCDLVDRIEIDANKKIYVYFKFKYKN